MSILGDGREGVERKRCVVYRGGRQAGHLLVLRCRLSILGDDHSRIEGRRCIFREVGEGLCRDGGGKRHLLVLRRQLSILRESRGTITCPGVLRVVDWEKALRVEGHRVLINQKGSWGRKIVITVDGWGEQRIRWNTNMIPRPFIGLNDCASGKDSENLVLESRKRTTGRTMSMMRT